MALKFATCPICKEEHALRANGQMSIHTTADNLRCDPTEQLRRTSIRLLPPEEQKKRRAAHKQRREQERAELERIRRLDREREERLAKRAPLDEYDEAYLKMDMEPSHVRQFDTFDRRIYGMSQVVRGGLPGTSRRH